jgi:hypothetical protein
LGVQWQTRKLSKQKKAEVLVVSFGGALDSARAQNLGDYHLVAAGKDKKFGTRDDKAVALGLASYDSSAHTVTPRGKVPKGSLQLTITATGSLDTQGRPLDGNRDGQPGGDFQVVLGK